MSRKSIIFIHPSYKALGKKDILYTNESLTPNLGLGYLGAYCRNHGFRTKIIDSRLPHYSIESLIRDIKQEEPLFIGITAFTNEIVQAGAAAKIIKKAFPDLPIVIGGPHSSAIPKETLKEFSNFDIAVIGEGEETILDIAKALSNGNRTELENIPGIAIRMSSGDIRVNTSRKNIEDINNLPFPSWDLFELPSYNKIFIVATSRGCPYSCYFCSPHYLGKQVRVRTPFNVVDEIEHIVNNFGAKKIQFADATLSLMGEQTFIMCDEILKRGLNKKIEWDCETRADSLNLKLLKKMKEVGCRWIALGVETGSERILREVVKKGETKEQIKRAVSLVKKIGIKVRGFFIFGHYGETTDTIKETIRFALELNPDALSFGLMVPNPGSEIRQIAEKKMGGLKILSNHWENYNQFNYDCMELNNLPLEELKRWRAKAYFTFYLHHPLKALELLLDESGYNYNLKGFFKIPFMLLKQRIK